MSVNTIEKILWEFGNEPARATEFVRDPEGYLAQFQLSPAEFKMVRKMDVKALAEYGVSSLLLMMSWPLLHDNSELMQFDYLRKMNDGKLPNNMKLPSWQFNGLRVALWVIVTKAKVLSLFGVKKRLM